MHHTPAWSEDVATATFEDIAPVTDGILTIQNNHFIPRLDFRLYTAAVMATDIQRASISTPTLRQLSPPFMRPVMAGLVPTSPAQIALWDRNPLRLLKEEEVTIEALHDAGVNQRITIGQTWMHQFQATPAGDIITMRGTSTSTATANAWTQLTMTWADTLPQGRYAVVGMVHFSANAQLARCILEQEFYRPGSVSISDLGNAGHPIFRMGGLGQWGFFNSYAMPNIEALCNGADATHEVYLDFVRVG